LESIFVDEDNNPISYKTLYNCPHNKSIVCSSYKKNKCKEKTCNAFKKHMEDILKYIPCFKWN